MLTAMAMLLAVSAEPAALSPGYVFITQATGNGNLSTWTAAGGMSGLGAGDAICRAEASAANVTNSNAYVAAMSDGTNDMYCRVHALSGTVSDKCGQVSLPANAGPWLRRDGQIFATLDTLRNDNAAIEPPLFYADGTSALGAVAFNGTQHGMVFDALDGACVDWTSSVNHYVFGTAAGSSAGYFENNGISCSQTRNLECIASGQHSALSVARQSGREAFGTQSEGNGNLSTWANAGGAVGLAAGDAVCQAEASASGLTAPGSFKAWLSDSTQPLNAIDRFQNDGPWIRTDGILIAPSKSALTDIATMTSAPTTLASGAFPVITSFPWTGTTQSGTVAGATCSGWTSTSGSGANGYNGVLNYWSDITQQACDTVTSTLYCFSDLDRIFDGAMEAIPY